MLSLNFFLSNFGKTIKSNSSKYAFGLLILLYLFCMFVYPAAKGNIMNTLHSWQSFNAGFLALIAALISITSTRCQQLEDLRRKRIANEALLPEALASILSNLETISSVYLERYKEDDSLKLSWHDRKSIKVPEISLSEFDKTIISDAVFCGDLQGKDSLHKILSEYQIICARLIPMCSVSENSTYMHDTKETIERELVFIAEVYGKISIHLTRIRRDTNKISLDLKSITISSIMLLYRNDRVLGEKLAEKLKIK